MSNRMVISGLKVAFDKEGTDGEFYGLVDGEV